MAWYESADAPSEWPNPIPLVTFPPGGLYRDVMFERIEREQRRWYVAFSGSSLSNVLVAVEAGMGVSLLPVGTARKRRLRPYPPLGSEAAIAVSLYAWEGDGPAADARGVVGSADDGEGPRADERIERGEVHGHAGFPFSRVR